MTVIDKLISDYVSLTYWCKGPPRRHVKLHRGLVHVVDILRGYIVLLPHPDDKLVEGHYLLFGILWDLLSQ